MTAPPAEANLDDLRRRARRRLVGAIVLALAAAVFVPMLLESEPKPLGEDVSVRIPPVDDGKFVNKLGEKGRTDTKAAATKGDAKQDAAKAEGARKDAAKSDPPKADAEAPAPAADAPKAEVAPPQASAAEPPAAPKRSLEEAEQRVLAAPAKAPSTSTVPAPAPAAKAPPPDAAATAAPAAPAPAKADPTAKADAGSAAFSVQLAAFSDDKGANALANRLKKSGYAAYTEPLETSRGTLWRVRVGPFPSREAAAAVRDKLKGEGHSGIVAPVK